MSLNTNDFPVVKCSSDRLERLLNSSPLKTLGDIEDFMKIATPLPRLLIIIDNCEKYMIEYKKEDMWIVAYDDLTHVYTAHIYEEDETVCTTIYAPEHIVNAKTDKEINAYNDKAYELSKKAIAVCGTIQYAILYPERMFKMGRKGKKVLNKKPKYGNDEQLFHRINALHSTLTQTVSTGKGTPHSHEYDVRGFYRHCKSGKIVFVKPYTRCKGRGAKISHEYLVEVKTNE